MNIATYNFFNLNNIIKNITNEKIGFYFSFSLHLIFFIFIIGFPDFFKSAPINIPSVIPIEIINISDTTSMPKKNIENISKKKNEPMTKNDNLDNVDPKIEKKPKIENIPEKKIKFNNAETIIEKKVQIKDKPEKNIEKIIVEEKKIIKPEKTKPDEIIIKKDLVEEKIESLPTKKIKPKIKPKPKISEPVVQDTDINVLVKSKPKPKFNIASMLKDLRNDKTLMEKKIVQKNVNKNQTSNNSLENKTSEQLSISEIDLLIQQLSACWSAPAGAVIKKGMVVKISAKIQPNRKVLYESVRIIDTNIPQSNPFYGPITESAMRTLLNPECNPLKLPEKKYEFWKNLTINFDHSIMKGYQ